MSNTNYLNLLAEAHAFTVYNLYGERAMRDTVLPLKKYDDATMRIVYNHIIDILSPLKNDNIANHCSLICWTINKKLLQFDLHPILTIGYMLFNGEEKLYYTDRKKLLMQLGNVPPLMVADFHVWLTIGDYIIDPTYMSSVYAINPEAYSEQTFCNNAVIVHKYEKQSLIIENHTFEYIPQMTGTFLLTD